MRGLYFRRLAALLAALALGFVAESGHGQGAAGAKPDQIKFDTADGVKIRGHFYAAAKRNAPVVMILHALGEKSTQKGYTELAEALQKKDYNVLTFDFRGHGNSKEVEAGDFWLKNRSYVKASAQKSE